MFDRELLNLPNIRSTLVVLVVWSLLEATCIVGQAAGLSLALVGLWEGARFEQVIGAFSGFSCSFIAVRLVLNARERFIDGYATRVASTMRADLFDSIFRTGAPAVQAFGTGTTATMLLEGVDKVQDYVKLVLPKFVNMAVLPVVFALSIWIADWVSGVVVVILLPSMILLMQLIGKTTAERSRAQHAAFKVMSNHFVDSVRGVSTLSTFEVSKTYASRVFAVSERFREATMRMLKTATLSGSVLDLFATLAIAAVSIMLGLRLIDGSLVLLPALFVLILVPEYFRPIREFASDYHASLDGVNSLRTIRTMLAATNDVPPEVDLPRWERTSVLQVRHLSKRYDGVSALVDDSFTLQGFECIGVIGVSGSGKSTLLRILAGLEDPSSGTFVFDQTQTTSTAQSHGTLRQASWQQQIAYIPQDPYIFRGTLRENLTLYNPHASDARIDEVIDQLGLRALVDELPAGLLSIIGEGGRGLSGGQAQRIALARVLLDEGRTILLFDEPTAHLDIEMEYELKQIMLEVMKDKLVIFATHRLHWLDSFDRVMVLEAGSIVEEGSVNALFEQDAHLTRLVSALRGGDAS
ncbi:thiol reductant ABC exporter subunit CydD [Anaerotardibacter muris]|uniref:thiol reductant ABC exporter subunit CydD n=1 Tax=Anaerotardibacter muris TaxID=2941505 RepID=UPI00203C6102|nr:thiol reductant ABC exporter subunit CydD [Anaerotardibacter muris]